MYRCYAKPIEIVPKQDTKNVPKIPIEDLTHRRHNPQCKELCISLKKTFAIIGLRILTIKNIGVNNSDFEKIKETY